MEQTNAKVFYIELKEFIENVLYLQIHVTSLNMTVSLLNLTASFFHLTQTSNCYG